MAASIDLDEILGRLSPLGEVTAPVRRAWALLGRDDLRILFGGRLYLKVDDQSKPNFVCRGMGPFRPNDRQTLKSYYEVPSEVLADRGSLISWVRGAIRAGQKSLEP